ncbi:MAG: hypothetical protein FJ398_07285, partial [Verrucomicrobia bacterium]|nr:hypothetical protein [Verrucomicrobiota bacterium]
FPRFSGRWRLRSGRWRLRSGRWRLRSGRWRLRSGRWRLCSGWWRLRSGRWRLVTRRFPRFSGWWRLRSGGGLVIRGFVPARFLRFAGARFSWFFRFLFGFVLGCNGKLQRHQDRGHDAVLEVFHRGAEFDEC